MAVIVDDGHLGRMLVIQLLCSFGLQQEVFVHEFLHTGLVLMLIFRLILFFRRYRARNYGFYLKLQNKFVILCR